MDMATYQANRQVKVETPFGDALIFSRLLVAEQLSQPFEIDLTMLSDKGDLNADTILGKPVTVHVTNSDKLNRYFHGWVTDFSQSGYSHRLHEYRAVVRPWYWFLTRTSDCRIFQGKTVPEIFDEVCRKAGFADFKIDVGSYEPWEYCVQYRESDFNFLSRLLEHEGIFYYFEHSKDKHLMVLTDQVSKLTTADGYGSVPYFPPGDTDVIRERDHLSAWSFQKAFHPGKFATREFDFKAPSTLLDGTHTISRGHEAAKYEIYDYPAISPTPNTNAVNRIAKVRVEELQCSQMTARGSGDAMGLTTGKRFKLTGFPRSDLNIDYIVKGTSIDVTADNYQSGGSGGEGTQFNISVEAMDAREAFRPPRLTPKPLIQGTQTAIVCGGKGDEICTDEFSRVKVQFHWDRHGKMDDSSSCWVRVGQAWAGKQWGGIQIPRVGHEVIVSFLEGDPDRPLIIGSVYNGSNKPPYELGANKTQSGFKSRSSPEGTADNFNEIRFEDKKGSEQLFIQAEKNQDINVKNDETHTVGNDRKKDIKHDETTTIGNDRTESVGGNEKITVTKDRTIDVSGNETASVKQDRKHTVNQNETIAVDQAQKLTVGKDQTIKIGAGQKVDITDDQKVDIGKNQKVDIGSNHDVHVGKNQTFDVDGNHTSKIGKKVLIDAGDSITITNGKASITLSANGNITIKGAAITIDASGNVNIKAPGNDIVLKAQHVLQN